MLFAMANPDDVYLSQGPSRQEDVGKEKSDEVKFKQGAMLKKRIRDVTM